MKVLMLTWEFPPDHVGGLGKHVCQLSGALASQGVEVHVITPGKQEATSGGGDMPFVHHIVPYGVSAPDFVSWVLQLNIAMGERASRLVQEDGCFDLVHAHDWLVAFAGRAFKHAFHVPLVATIHATEAGRNAGIHSRQQAYISNVEWWLGYEAWRVICCSEYMQREVRGVFSMPHDKISVVPNGVEPDEFQGTDRTLSRQTFASDDQKLLFFIGRLVREKGVHVLLEASRILLQQGENIKLVIAGAGPYEEELKYLAASLGIYSRVYFTGKVSDKMRNHLYRWADASICPSLYEPFGIVALEAMAAGSGLVASDTGGLSEVVRHEVTGLKVPPGDPAALAAATSRLLHDKGLRADLGRSAARTVRRDYSWAGIAKKTLELYADVLSQHHGSPWVVSDQRIQRRLPYESRAYGRRRRVAAEAIDGRSAQTAGPGGQPAGDGTHS